MTLSLSERAGAIKPSPTLGIAAKARALKAQGIDVISLSVGEPDFNTPELICRAAVSAIEQGLTKYTPSAGLPELRKSVADHLHGRYGVMATPDRVVLSCGAKHSIYNTCQVLLNPGDEVILFAPYWATYADQIRLAGAIPVPVTTKGLQGFIPDFEEIKSALTPRTRAIFVNSPSNPTGAVFGRALMKQIAELALDRGIWLVSDEIYSELVYEGQHVSLAEFGEDVLIQTVLVDGFSKTYSMTGWRLGYAFAPTYVAQAMSNLQDQVTSNPTSFVQAGGIEALRLDPATVEGMRNEFRARRDLALDILKTVPGIETPVPGGAFYLFPDVSKYLCGAIPDDNALAELLLEKARVAVVPGSAFEGPGHLRLSYALGQEQLREALTRIKSTLESLPRL